MWRASEPARTLAFWRKPKTSLITWLFLYKQLILRCLLQLKIRDVAQLVARQFWELDAAGSSPVIPTISSVHNGFELWTLDFFVISSFFVMYGAGFKACSFVLCGFSNILDCYTFSGICLVIASAFGYLNIPNEFVMDHNSLTAVFTNTFSLINRYLIYKFP